MTDDATTPRGLLKVGDTIHVRMAGLTAFGNVWCRGQTIVLDDGMISSSIDRNGDSWLDEIDTEGARIGRGPWPAGTPTWEYGDPSWEEAREVARQAAWAEANPVARAEALVALQQTFGDPPKTSWTTAEWLPGEHPTERAAAAQAARLAAERSV